MAEELPDEAPEADALEQRQEAYETVGDADAIPGADGLEVPEADALEQARTVTDDEPDPRT